MDDIDSLQKKILSLVEDFYELKNENSNYFVPGVSHIPVSGRVLSAEDYKSMVAAALDGWLTAGEFTDKFEKDLSKFLGCRHSLMVNSGSSANLVIMSGITKLLDLQPGDEIITSGVNFPTTLNPIIQNNLVPVLIDVDIGTYNINIDLIESAINSKTKGIVLAHTLGNPFDVASILEICEKYDLFLMEDCCDALGAKFDNKIVGNFGLAGSLSFYPAHHITTGEGGAVYTNSPKLKKIMESIRDWGRDCYCPPGVDNTCKKRYDWQLGELPYGYDHKYTYSNIGYNLKSSDLQASIGTTQLNKAGDFIKKRNENFVKLFNNFSEFGEFILPKSLESAQPSWFGFPLTIKDDASFKRDDLLKFYQERNIGNRLLFAGNIKKQPAYQKANMIVGSDLTNSDTVMNNTFWLGVYPGLNDEMIDYVFESTKEFISR